MAKNSNIIILGIAAALVIIVIGAVVIGGICCLGSMVVAPNNSQVSNNQPSSTSYDSTVKDRQNAQSDYESKLSIVQIQQKSLDNYAQQSNNYINDMASIKSFIDNYKQQLDAYQSKCYDAIAAGKRYQQYLSPSSADYKNVQNNEAILSENILTYTNGYNLIVSTYNKYKVQYEALNDLQNKYLAVQNAYNDMINYANAAGSYSTLSKEWVDGYGLKVDAYEKACNAAIYATRACKQYFEVGSSGYRSLTDAETQLAKSAADARTSYNELKSSNEDYQSFVSIVKFGTDLLPLIG